MGSASFMCGPKVARRTRSQQIEQRASTIEQSHLVPVGPACDGVSHSISRPRYGAESPGFKAHPPLRTQHPNACRAVGMLRRYQPRIGLSTPGPLGSASRHPRGSRFPAPAGMGRARTFARGAGIPGRACRHRTLPSSGSSRTVGSLTAGAAGSSGRGRRLSGRTGGAGAAPAPRLRHPAAGRRPGPAPVGLAPAGAEPAARSGSRAPAAARHRPGAARRAGR